MTLSCLVICWLAGICLASSLKIPSWCLWLAVPLPIAVGVLWWRDWRARLPAFCALFLVLGALRYGAAVPRFDETHLAHYNGRGQVTLVGIVADEPDVRDRYVDLRVAARSLALGGTERDVKGLALVRVPRYPPYAYGDELQIEGELQTPPIVGGFSYRDYLARQGIHSMVDRGQIIRLSQHRGDPFHHALLALKGRLQATIARLFPEPSASLLTGILLGVEGGIPPALMEDFNTTGTTHIIAISGFNIAIVASTIGLATKRFLGAYKSAFFSILAITFYTVLVGADAAVVRAAIMGALMLLAIVAGRRSLAFASLAAAAFLMSAWNPFVLWDIGFQLSFAATLGLVVLVPPLEERLEGFVSRLMPEDKATTVVRLLSEPLIVTLAAQLAVWPLTVYYFHRFSIVSLLTNFLILSAQPGVMMLGGIATIAGALHPFVGQPIAWVAWLFLAYTITVVRVTAHFPLNSLELARFGVAPVLLYYALLATVTVMAGQGRTRLKQAWQRLCQGLRTKLVIGALALLAILAWTAALQMPDGRLHVVFFDVGQGDAIFIQCPGGQQILVDGGPSPAALLSQLGGQMPFWDRSLDLVILTHPQDDHLTGLLEVLSRYDVKQVIDSGQQCDGALCQEWQELIGERAIACRRAEAGMRINVGGEVQLDVLHPPSRLLAGTTSDINNNSIAARLTYGRFTLLLGGDVQQDAERVLLASDQPLESLVLKLPHHGADTSLGLPFLQAVDPQMAIISVGTDNYFGHPSEATLAKLQDVPTYRTDQQGTIQIVSDGERYWVATQR